MLSVKRPTWLMLSLVLVVVQDAKTGKMRDTGVRFTDIAGLDHIVVEMREIVKMLLNDPAYAKVRGAVSLWWSSGQVQSHVMCCHETYF